MLGFVTPHLAARSSGSPATLCFLFWSESDLFWLSHAGWLGGAPACPGGWRQAAVSRDGSDEWVLPRCSRDGGDVSPHERRRVVFFQQMAAAAGRDDARGARRRREEPAVSFPQVFMTFTFYLPLATSQPWGTQTLFLCLPRWWFSTVSASSVEPLWLGVAPLFNVQK